MPPLTRPLHFLLTLCNTIQQQASLTPSHATTFQNEIMKHGREAPADCPKNTQWYQCYNGFAGCCSIDVCTKGSCPDNRQDSDDSSSSSSAAKSTRTTRATSSTTSTSTTSTSSTMSSNDSTSFPAFATTTSDETTSTAASSSSSSLSTSKPTSSSPSIMSDRVATRTVPNDSTVTVTRHTTITQELPTTTTDPTASSTTDTTQQSITSSAFETPSPTAPSVTAPPKQSSGGINTGVVVGIAVGGAFAVALIAVLIWLWRSRRRNRGVKEIEREAGNESMFVDKTRLHESIFGGRPSRRRESATLPRHPTPHQASEQGYGYDPFAPFGGKVHQMQRAQDHSAHCSTDSKLSPRPNRSTGGDVASADPQHIRDGWPRCAGHRAARHGRDRWSCCRRRRQPEARDPVREGG